MADDIMSIMARAQARQQQGSTQTSDDWRQHIPQPDTSNNDWGGYRPKTYEYTDWAGKKQQAPYVPAAPRPDAFNNVPGVENDPSDALGLWNMSRYYDSGAIRAPQWYVHGGVDSYGDSSANPYYQTDSYKNTYGAGRNPFAEAHPNWNWTEGDLSSTRPGWDSQGNVIGGYKPDGSTRPYVPGPNDRYQGGGPPPPKVRGNGWGGQDWWNTGSGGGSSGGSSNASGNNSGAGTPARTQIYGGMGGGTSSGMASRSSMGASRGTSRGGMTMAYSPKAQPYSEVRKAPPTTATQSAQAPMMEDELRGLAQRQYANRSNQQFGGSADFAPQGAPNAPRFPRPAPNNPMAGQFGVVNLGAPEYNNGNPYYNKWGNLRAPFRNAMTQGTNWDLGGPNGAALFGAARSYNYFPQQSASFMNYPMWATQALPPQFGGIDPMTAMMAFGGF